MHVNFCVILNISNESLKDFEDPSLMKVSTEIEKNVDYELVALSMSKFTFHGIIWHNQYKNIPCGMPRLSVLDMSAFTVSSLKLAFKCA